MSINTQNNKSRTTTYVSETIITLLHKIKMFNVKDYFKIINFKPNSSIH